jgi:hypothetical protein
VAGGCRCRRREKFAFTIAEVTDALALEVVEIPSPAGTEVT